MLLKELGDERWIAVMVLALLTSDSEGFLSATIGHLLLRRTKR